MTRDEVLQHIDEGTNHYLRLLGSAEHMEYKDAGYYCEVHPKEGHCGVSFIFNVKLDGLSDAEVKEKVAHIKAMNKPVWWSLTSSQRVKELIQEGKVEQLDGQIKDSCEEEGSEKEFYMALLPDEKPYCPPVNAVTVKKVDSIEDFGVWANLANQLLHGGERLVHPVNHFHLRQKGHLACYLAYYLDEPASVAAIVDNNGICSLEFVATAPKCRRRGLARAVCCAAIEDAFEGGAQIITLRSSEEAEPLYKALGFKCY